jgi:hypothetical protein
MGAIASMGGEESVVWNESIAAMIPHSERQRVHDKGSLNVSAIQFTK